MPALAPVPGVIKVRVGFTVGLDTSTGTHIFVGYGATRPNNAQLQTMANTISTSWNTRLAGLMHPSVALTSVTTTDLADNTLAPGVTTGNQLGTRAGTVLPANACVLINFKMVRRYRGGHPRVYLPFGVAADVTNAQTWVGTFVTAVSTAWQLFINDVLVTPGAWGGAGNLVNVSYYHLGEWKPTPAGGYVRVPTPRNPPLVDPLISSVVSPTFGSQRRRVRSV